MATTPVPGRCSENVCVDGAAPRKRGQPFLPSQIVADTPITASTVNRSTNIEIILSDVCSRHGLARWELASEYRGRRHAAARNEAAYLLRVNLALTHARIGKELGDRSYSTVIHMIGQHEALLARSKGKQ